MNSPQNRSGMGFSRPRDGLLIALLIMYALIVAGHAVLRYQGMWTEGDSARMTLALEAVREEGTVTPTTELYSHGFAYQVVSLFIGSLAGSSSQALQATVYPFVSTILLCVAAFAFFGRVLPSKTAAMLATLLLFFQPDMVFVILRGSHEMLDWMLMLTALAAFLRTVGRSLRTVLVNVIVFYLAISGMVATNAFFASAFLGAITFGLLLGFVVSFILRRRRSASSAALRRLIYTSLSCAVLIYIFMAYIYPAAMSDLGLLSNFLERGSALLLSFDTTGQTYAYVSYGWLSRNVYLGLTAFTWLLIALSFVEWLRRAKGILVDRHAIELHKDLDWLLYAGFAGQIALSTLLDITGALGASLQLRLFPGFTVLAVALLVRAIWRISASDRFRGRARQLALGLGGLVVVWSAAAAVLKATNEPVLSNKWVFYSVPEDAAIYWTDNSVTYEDVWIGLDGRVRNLFVFKYGSVSASGNDYHSHRVRPEDGYFFISERERVLGLRAGVSMPSVLDMNQVYANGEVSLFHKRPQTPYQR